MLDTCAHKMSLKRKCFSVGEKMQIIRRLEAGERNVNLAKEFYVRQSTITTIQKNKDKIKALFNSNVLKPKRVKMSTQDQVDKALLLVVHNATQSRNPIKWSTASGKS